MESTYRIQVEIKRKLKKLFYLGNILFYWIAGINHWINPDWYYPLIPSYLAYPEVINILTGAIEILCGIGLMFASTKKFAANILVIMLVAFVASHWHFIEQGSCMEGVMCISPWMAWVRLVVIQPLLIWALIWIKNTSYGFTTT